MLCVTFDVALSWRGLTTHVDDFHGPLHPPFPRGTLAVRESSFSECSFVTFCTHTNVRKGNCGDCEALYKGHVEPNGAINHHIARAVSVVLDNMSALHNIDQASIDVSLDVKTCAQPSVTLCTTEYAYTSSLVPYCVKLQDSMPCLSRHMDVSTA